MHTLDQHRDLIARLRCLQAQVDDIHRVLASGWPTAATMPEATLLDEWTLQPRPAVVVAGYDPSGRYLVSSPVVLHRLGTDVLRTHTAWYRLGAPSLEGGPPQ